ncbi:MAG TPA: acVLRF1 family peptidyl-tRNA hydrolase, partial [Pseudonocardiaceae bacterium]
MSTVRPAPGGGKYVAITPVRAVGWFDRFGDRHQGILRTELTDDQVSVLARDGTIAVVRVPFAPLRTAAGVRIDWLPGEPPLRRPGLAVDDLVAHLLLPRRIGLLLVRLGGHSVGIAVGGHVLTSATDRKQVHGRNKAGGWSQQRFARRRAGQARDALRAAADDAVRVLVPALPELAAVVLGGDRRALDTLRADQRLTNVFAMALPRVLDVPEPRRTVLDDAAVRACDVEILVTE